MSGNQTPALQVFSDGQGSVLAANLNTFVQGGALANDLQGITGVPSMTVWINGGVSIGDGLQGMFYWNDTSTTDSDGGITCLAPFGALTGRWLRLLSVPTEAVTFPNETAFPPFTPTLNASVYGAVGTGQPPVGQFSLAAIKTLFGTAALVTNFPYVPFAVAPSTNAVAPTVAGLALLTTAVETNTREWFLTVNYDSSVGGGLNPRYLGDKVAIFSGANIHAGSGDGWCQNHVMTLNGGGTGIIVQGYEGDHNNFSDARADPLLAPTFSTPFYGFTSTGAGTFPMTAAFAALAASQTWGRGFLAILNSCIYSAFEDRSSAQSSFAVFGGHSVGLDTLNAVITSASVRMALGQKAIWSNLAQTQAVADYVDGAFNRIVGNGAAAIWTDSIELAPLTDLHSSLGTSGLRWTTVFAQNATINTSDAREKTYSAGVSPEYTKDGNEVPPLPPMTPLFRDIAKEIGVHKWDVAQRVKKPVKVTKPVPKMREGTVDSEEHYQDDATGKWHVRPIKKPEMVQDHVVHQLHHHETGEPLMEQVFEAQADPENPGKMIKAPALNPDGSNKLVPKTYIEWLFEDQPVDDFEWEDRAGIRDHIAPPAQAVKAALDKHGSTIAAWGLSDPNDPDSRQNIVPDAIHFIGARALYEALDMIEALKSQVEALQAKVDAG